MIRINGTDYAFEAGVSLRELAESHFTDIPKVVFEDFVVVVNNAAIGSALAEESVLTDGDTVFLVPKVDGG